MNASLRFRINTPTIVHETIDGEVVIINLENGNYYSLDGVGADIWGTIGTRASVSEIVEELNGHYHADSVQIERAVAKFLVELQQDDLVVPDGIDASGTDYASKPQADGELLDFEVPVLNRYTDMQDLLLLDPIHDVDEAGWPMMPPETSLE